MPHPKLFSGCYPCGIVYADKSRERHGDYVRLAFLDYATLTLDVEKDCPADLRAVVEADARAIQARQGEEYPIAGNMTVILGHGLVPVNQK